MIKVILLLLVLTVINTSVYAEEQNDFLEIKFEPEEYIERNSTDAAQDRLLFFPPIFIPLPGIRPVGANAAATTTTTTTTTTPAPMCVATCCAYACPTGATCPAMASMAGAMCTPATAPTRCYQTTPAAMCSGCSATMLPTGCTAACAAEVICTP